MNNKTKRANMKAISQYKEQYNMGILDLADFMCKLACHHFDGIKDAIEFYFVEEGYFTDVAEGLDYYDNN
mgnify:CR=1 FL=1